MLRGDRTGPRKGLLQEIWYFRGRRVFYRKVS